MVKKILYPHQILRPYLEYYLFLEIEIDKESYDIFCTFPNGSCVMNVFYSQDLPIFIFQEKNIENLRSFVSGYLNHGVKLGKSGNYKCVFIQFTPLGSYHLFGIPPSKYFNTFINTEDLLGKTATYLIEDINLAKCSFDIADCLNSFFYKFLYVKKTAITTTEYIFNKIVQEKGIIKVEKLAQKFNYPLRKLDRKFNNLLGLTPKDYAWLTRLSKAYQLLLFNPNFSISDVIYTLGYYDQSHMIRHFLKYSDITPHDLRSANHKILFSTLLVTSLKKDEMIE